MGPAGAATLGDAHTPAVLAEIQTWDERKVADWLGRVNSAAYADAFIENNITGATLLDCDAQALKEIGITKVGDRVRIMVAIKALRLECFPKQQKSVPIAQLLALSPVTSPPVLTTAAPPAPPPASSKPNLSPSTPDTNITMRTPTFAAPPKSASGGSLASPNKPDSPMRSANGLSSLLSNCVKFIGEEGQTRIVNIADCHDTSKVLEKALKKFTFADPGTLDPSLDSYSVYVTAEVGPAWQLTEEELFQICQDPARPERERLILKKRDTPPSMLELRQAQKIAREQQALLKDTAAANNLAKMKKLGGFFGETPASPITPSAIPNSSRGPKARIKEFFGGRPPSELISSNLQDYFPEATTAVLEKTVRNSIRRSQAMNVAASGRPSVYSRRYSNASAMSVASYRSLMPPVPSVGDAWISATALPKKRPGSMHRGVSMGNASLLDDGASMRARSILSMRDPEAASVRSRRSVSIHSVNLSKENGAGSPDLAGSSEEEVDEDEEEYELPGYLKDTLDATEEEDDKEIDSTIRARSMAFGGDEVDNIFATLGVDDTGPSSWIRGTLIGQGSFGSVVLGMNALTGELMAVKQVDLPRAAQSDTAVRKKSMLDALQREIALLRDMQHDNIVQYLGSNSDETHLNIFLEYVPGGSVTEMLTKYGAFKEPLVRQFVRQILTGLNYLHERDIIHRDIKGGNILVDNKGVIKISDFGISKKVEADLLQVEGTKASSHRPSLQGSVFWMAPEVVKQVQYTKKADIWSLGCLIVEMLTGQHPFPEFNQMQAIFKIGGADSAPEIPEGISLVGRDFLSKTFELDFNERPSAADLLAHAFCHASVA